MATAAILPTYWAPTPAKLSFSRDIMPILSDKCFKCHGPDGETRMANLRLDEPESVFALRHGEFPILPGKPEKSLVYQRITSKDETMPPRSSGKSLTTKEIETIKLWISQGGHYGKLWSFEALPHSVPVPTMKSSWPKEDMDQFILQRLKWAGLSPSPAASRSRWLRRVTLDLTGLPPTQTEIEGFSADKQPNAYEHVVDRLLASPHYGERVAVDWLDAARYGDSYGYQADLLSPTWPYRDWVVKAFNRNIPYNQFLTDQLAGDLLKSPTQDQRLATAFNRLNRQSNEGGSIPLEYKTAYAEDRVETFGTAVLGLTIGCAKCHDHKFDPITQKEYFQLFGYFNSIKEYGLYLSTEIVPTPSMLLPTPQQDVRMAALKSQDSAAKTNLASVTAAVEPRFEQWLASKPTKPEIPDLLARFPLDNYDSGKFVDGLGGKLVGEKIGKVDLVSSRKSKAVLLDGDNGVVLRGLPGRERWDSFTWSFWMKDPRQTHPIILMHRTGGTDVGFCGFDVMLEDGYLTARVMRTWPGNAVAIRTTDRIAKDQWTHMAWSWDGSGRASGLKIFLNGRPAQTVVLNDRLWKKVNDYGDLGPSGGDWSFGQRFRDAGFKGGKIADTAFADRPLSRLEVEQLYDGSSLTTALNSPMDHKDALREYFVAAIDKPSRDAREAVQKSQTELTQFEEGINEISVMEDTPQEIPAYLLARGQYDAPRNAQTLVHRGVPRSLPPLQVSGPNNRLALAKWVTQPDFPLTSRVAVNRLWQMVFGVGLVETTENLGVQGSQPSHPELLDYLARKFVNSGWDVKAMLRSFVLSATYRQDSSSTAKLNKIDPHNHLFARGPSSRLPAEMIRDTVLAASGLINPKIGGPPVNPYQPAGIWQENNTMSPAFVQSKGQDLYRRSLYSTWKRTTPIPSMMLFDATSREACTVRRPPTETPLQALVLLNDVQFVEASRALAELVLKQPGTDAERVKSAFVRLAGREPDAREASVLVDELRQQRTEFEANPSDAKKLIQLGDKKVDTKLDPSDLAAMTVTVQTVMNCDAVIWKR